MKIALVTAIAAFALDEDLAPLRAALERAGASVAVVAWDDPTVSWGRFDVVVLRSPWDYTQRPAEFLAWCERVGTQARLLNPLPVVRWNTDKHYLADLAAHGVPVIDSVFLEPGVEGNSGFDRQMPDHDELVVKPAIGAGARDTQRYTRAERAAAIAHAQRLLDAGRSVLVQPYLAQVDAAGETALVFFDGVFSHAIRKGPLLARGEGPTQALFATEDIVAREPGTAEFDVAHRALEAIPFGRLAYARIDLLPSPDGPRLLELELTEPSLFFAHAAGSADRFAAVLLAK
jgi:glutathione synthase/RimK-type ligase-like ATP-grasp enzyme